MTYLKLKREELLAECVKRNFDLGDEDAIKKMKKKQFIQLLITDDEDQAGELPPNKAPVKKNGEEQKAEVAPGAPENPEPKELTDEDIKQIIDDNDNEEGLCKAIISVPTDKETKEAILPTNRAELEEVIRYNVEGNVNMICGKLHARVQELEKQLKLKSKVVKSKKNSD
jgi:hypothetical protein